MTSPDNLPTLLRDWKRLCVQAPVIKQQTGNCIEVARQIDEWQTRLENLRGQSPALDLAIRDIAGKPEPEEHDITSLERIAAYDKKLPSGSGDDRRELPEPSEPASHAWPATVIAELKGNQKLLAEEMNARNGVVPIEEFAALVGWGPQCNNAVGGLITRFNKKLELLGYKDRVHRHDNAIVKRNCQST